MMAADESQGLSLPQRVPQAGIPPTHNHGPFTSVAAGGGGCPTHSPSQWDGGCSQLGTLGPLSLPAPKAREKKGVEGVEA